MGKLDSFISRQPSRDIRVPAIPDLAEAITNHGLKVGATKFMEGVEQWRQDLEKTLRQSIPEPETTTATPTPTSTTVVQTDPAVADALKAHIRAESAHGTDGKIVGENNAQALESKRIGELKPGYGRFGPLIGRSSVPSGETVTIPTGWNMIAPRRFTINGKLVINGVFMVVADPPASSSSTRVQFNNVGSEVALTRNSTILNTPHGLGGIPTSMRLALVADPTPEFGYAAGQEVDIISFCASASGLPPFAVELTETHIIVTQPDYDLYGVSKSGGNLVLAITLAKWKLRVYLER